MFIMMMMMIMTTTTTTTMMMRYANDWSNPEQGRVGLGIYLLNSRLVGEYGIDSEGDEIR